jgi:hypothetical protein
MTERKKEKKYIQNMVIRKKEKQKRIQLFLEV